MGVLRRARTKSLRSLTGWRLRAVACCPLLALLDGGLAVALAEMAMAGGIGADVEWHRDYTQAQWWFGEDQGRYIVTVPDTQALNEALAKGTENEDTASIGFRRIGKTGGDTLFGKTIAELKAAHTSFFTEWMEG